MHGSYTIRRKGALDALWTAAAPQQQRFRLVRLLGYGNIRTIRTDATHLNVLHSPVARCRPHFSRETERTKNRARNSYRWRSRIIVGSPPYPAQDSEQTHSPLFCA